MSVTARETLRPAPYRWSTCTSRSRALACVALILVLAGCMDLQALPPAATVASPTAAAASSAPANTLPTRLVHSWTCLMCIYELGTMVFDDGLVLRSDDGTALARHLAPGGLAWIRDRLDESPLAAGAASYGAVPGDPSDERDHTRHQFTMDRGGGSIWVTADVVAELAGGPNAWIIPDEMLALDQLSADLEDIDAWVPPDLWVDAWTPYRPERFLLFAEPWRDIAPEDVPANPGVDADRVPWPFQGRVDEIGTTRPGGDPLGLRCLVVDARVVERVAAAEATVGMQRSPYVPYVTNDYDWPRGNGRIIVGTRWLLPSERADCSMLDQRDW